MFATKSLVAFLSLSIVCSALPILRREVPQEHSHEQFLTSVRASLALDNPDSLGDPVFALLGNKAAVQGAGKTITDPDCLQQAIADQAFTNAKAANDVDGMVGALTYRALERNSGQVGAKSAACTAITATNPEIAAIQQHQDPASDGAAEANKAVTLELAKQIAAVGGDPQDALKSGTFAPGQLDDPTAAGNTCDDQNDTVGCIFTQNLLVEDATAEEIDAAVAGGSSGDASASGSSSDSSASASGAASETAATSAAEASASASATSSAAASSASSTASSSSDSDSTSSASGNLQTFTGSLGDVTPPAVTANGDGSFSVEGNADFKNLQNALVRSCDVQHNKCANAANSSGNKGDLTVEACGQQQTECNASAQSASAAGSASTGGNASAGSASASTAGNSDNNDASASATSSAAASSASSASSDSSSASGNLQAFTGNLGGTAPAVTAGGKGFIVENNDEFLNSAAALTRSCDVQHNACANAANSGGGFSVGDCDAQNTECKAAN
ncbi:hypothetical protein CYLTODRAFT_418758 [Cylindrobasidium torrendii FP15055 ss-10]|uniref:Uncharacterized protein n=1 Tax=Cylindrobasidium torrendii FP15055 ss-10 TaxID=1314674 RepID=A0A0D7BPK6_9AGAR|nr:hypothetical protein CYLTODRAFT_418758 [Cylindrobasidium torrendii FP15055 ss-10]